MSEIILHILINNRRRDGQRNKLRILRRSLRDVQNPFEMTTDEHFVELYRFPKHLCMELIDELKPFLNTTARSNAISCHVKILCALRFFATGSFQRSVGQDTLSSLSQTSVSRCVSEISMALNRIAHRYVQFPKKEEFTSIKSKFFEMFGFPGVVGLIDGTHIKVSAPRKEIEHVFYCRKGGHSMNVQIVCGADFQIFSANAQYGGTAHDAYVWRRSRVKSTLEKLYNEGERNFWLLGDSGYPLQPWLMTPFLAPNTEAENRYNVKHKQTRALVERCIGVLKSRFRCLSKERVLFYCPAKAGTIINACIVLHNVLIKARVPFLQDVELEIDFEIDEAPSADVNIRHSTNQILQKGRQTQSRIATQAFGS